ncbi:MAG: asparagine synthase (glutamine-hydrolyzing) [Deltaproteobacteria bacterium]|nr:asparagine synthase (glutamine-hydrolyzing) [Deltaproteobacteria bacterium]
MCGIAGALAGPGDVPPPGLVARMLVAQIHRGPDGGGLWADGPVVLGHRRLSIVDLSAAGRQPMTNEDGTMAVVVNGEIYNHAALRRELEAKGHTFRSHSDSEVVLHLYEDIGIGTPERLRGMFAFAVWDSRRRSLFLARDRFGEKPLYYAHVGDTFLFASEIAGLLADERVGRAIDLSALDAYLALQYVPHPDTIFSDIKKLPPGHYLQVEAGGAAARVRPYYNLADSAAREPAPATEAEALTSIRSTVEEAVASRLMSDVPLGAFLSGGVDSSIIVACMARRSSRPVKTFSVGFSDAGATELPYARLVADRYRTDHHELMVDPDMTALLPSVMRHHGEPFGDTSAIPTRYLCEMTRKDVVVALSGDGGDEVFGGYRRYVWSHVADMLRRLPGPLAVAVTKTMRAVPGARLRWLRRYADAVDAGEAAGYLEFIGHFPCDERMALYTPDLSEKFRHDQTAQRFAARLGALPAGAPVNRLSALDIQTYLPDDILTKVDVASMTHGLEARAPLVDHHVVELGMRLPATAKLRHFEGKSLFKQAFADLLPPAILDRSKRGFALPTRHWLGGKLHAFARETLLSNAAHARGLFQREAVESLLDRHRAGEDHGERIWNLLALEIWHREILDGRAHFLADLKRREHEATAPVGVA